LRYLIGACPLRLECDSTASVELRGSAARAQDKFFTQLKNSADGFSVIAEFFGRGLLNNTSASAPA